MSVGSVQTFYGALAVLAWVVMAGLVLVRLAAIRSERARDAWESVVDAVAPSALGLAWFVAVLATAGSLYFSEVAGYEPCRLCWYQRSAMYPIVIVLGVAAARRDRAGAIYALALALVGAVISLYHSVLEWIPALDTGACSATTPCTLVWFRVFGVISLPMLALTAFSLIIVILAIRIQRPHERSDP